MSLSDEVRQQAQAFCEEGDYAGAKQIVESFGAVWPQDFVETKASLVEKKEDPYRRPRKTQRRRKRYVVRRSEVKRRFDKTFPNACKAQEEKRKSDT